MDKDTASTSTAEDYTRQCIALAAEATMRLSLLSKLMKEHGDEARAMDVDEAIQYLDGAVSDA